MKSNAIAEVVSATVYELVAQIFVSSGQDNGAENPRFGSFIRIESGSTNLKVIAVVNNVITGPIDGVHRATAFGLTRQELYKQQPQIFALLKTDINATIIGYLEGMRSFQYLPPHPPEVHDFVYHATKSDIDAVTESMDFLRLLSGAAPGICDELLAASVREAYLAKGKDSQFLYSAGQAFCQMYRNEYDRLVSMLKKIRPH